MKTIMADINMQDVDLYELLGITSTASVQEVKKAYRKKALTCHPDKNPDNPRAAELFHQLSKALEILIDDSARAAYDRVLNGKKAAKLRHRELDERRKKLKEDLEAREKAAAETASSGWKYDSRTDEEKLQAEIDRLRKEGSQQVDEEVEFVRQQILRESKTPSTVDDHWSSGQNRLRIRWKANKEDPNNGGYPYEKLHNIFSKYGDIVALVISQKKNGSALVEFKTKEAVETALSLEKGLITNPLTVERLNSESKVNSRETSSPKPSPKLADITKTEEEANGRPPSASLFPSVNPTPSPVVSTPMTTYASAPDFSQLLYANYLTGQQLRYPGSLPVSLAGAMQQSIHHSVPQLQTQMVLPMMMPGVAGYGQYPQYRAYPGTQFSYPTSNAYTGGYAALPNYANSLQYLTAGAPLMAGSIPSASPASRASYATGLPVFTGQMAHNFSSPGAMQSMGNTAAPVFYSQLLSGLPGVIPR